MKIQESIQQLLQVLKCQRCLAPRSLNVYKLILNQFEKFLLQMYAIDTTQELDRLLAKDIEKFWKDDSNISWSSKELRKSVVTRLINFLIAHDKIKNKGAGLFSPILKAKSALSKFYPTLSTITPKKDLNRKQKCLLALLTNGLRIAEILLVKKADFSMGFSRLLVNGKGSKQRIISILPETQAAISDCFEELSDLESLFNLSLPSVRRRIKEITEEGSAPHSFRRKAATDSFLKEDDSEDIQKKLGHTSANTTGIYIGKDACVSRMLKDYKTCHPRA